ncbi:MAG: response regulator [Planctomycetales bacterium]|nr:response regulator [Planctomycetales bacterium]
MTTILLADDNQAIRESLAIRLKKHGYSVALACNGLEAVEEAAGGDFALILMDLNMPELDGLEAAEQIRQNEQTAHVPIIALTAYALPEDPLRARESGFNDFHTKPVDFERLLQQIQSLIEIGQTTAW